MEVRKKDISGKKKALEKVHLKGHVKKQINQENLNSLNKLRSKCEKYSHEHIPESNMKLLPAWKTALWVQ